MTRAVAERAEAIAASGAHRDIVTALVREAAVGAFGPPETVWGWVYEAAHDARRREVFAAARTRGHKIDASGVVDASRLYTPAHIVTFLLNNSLGALWREMHPSEPEPLELPLLVDDVLHSDRRPRPLREVRLLDPCCGCGAFLVPAFDLFEELYARERALAAAGRVPSDWVVPPDEVPRTIVERNLFGADLDAGAVAIAGTLLRDRAGGDADPNLFVPQLPLGSLDPAIWPDERFDIVCTNPPYVGFRMLDAAVKDAVRANDPMARSDLAIAFQSRCFDLLADGGLCATVTPAAWLTSREALPLREHILAEGGPRLTVALGQRVFDQAPLLFVGLGVVERGRNPKRVHVLRPPTGSGEDGLEDAARNLPDAVPLDLIADLPLRPFLPGAPPAVLRLTDHGPRVGDLFRSFDGLWTGDNARDTRHWWEIAPDAVGWRALSGGQGNAPWSGAIRRRVRERDAAGQPDRRGAVEYARVAGGRLAARLVENGAASLAGIVTLVPRDAEGVDRVEEVLAIFNTRIGMAWLRTLTSGLNFNPGYAAEIPLGRTPPPEHLRGLVRELVDGTAALTRRDPTADTFVATRSPWVACELASRVSALESALDAALADHLGLDRATYATLPPVVRTRRRGNDLDDHLMVHVLRTLGFQWPATDPQRPPGGPMRVVDVAEAVHDALRVEGAGREVQERDLARWVATRLPGYQLTRFLRRPVVEVRDGVVRLLPRQGG